MRILIINGPNLNLLAKREPEKYGGRAFEDYLAELRSAFPDAVLEFFQSNIEGELIDLVHGADGHCNGIVINAGGYSHNSVALRDAIAAVRVPVIEVHITNVLDREQFRHVSMIGGVCIGTVMGLGLDGYRLAVDHLMRIKE